MVPKYYAYSCTIRSKVELHFVATVAEHNLNVPVLGFLPNKDLHYLQNDVDKTHPKHGRSPDMTLGTPVN
jgi:hypothetical protein